MTESPARLDLKELGAYIDGELEGQRRGQVASHLAGCPADAALAADYGHLNLLLRRGLGDAAGQELPRSLQRLILVRRLRWQRQRGAIAAAILFLFIAYRWGSMVDQHGTPACRLGRAGSRCRCRLSRRCACTISSADFR